MRDIFRDHDVDQLVACGGEVTYGRITVVLPRVFGFCRGVLRALRLLEHALEQRNQRDLWLLGEVIHNETVNSHFEACGAHVLPETAPERVFDLASRADIAVIPAFGLPADLTRRVQAFFGAEGEVVDTTCAYVKRIWSFVEEMAAASRTLVIHGKPDHPETRAIVSRASSPDNCAIVLPSLAEARRLAEVIRLGPRRVLPFDWIHRPKQADFRRLAIANQTTMLSSETRAIEALLRDAVQTIGGNLQSVHTICQATQERQDAALAVCRSGCDIILVVGGYGSSNTNQLYRLAANATSSYFISGSEALTANVIHHFDPKAHRVMATARWVPRGDVRVGVLAGASCPPSDIGDVIRSLRSYG